VGPGGGVITAMRGVNALGQDRLNQLQTQAQTQLAQQQAQLMPYQILLQQATNPMSWINPQVGQALMNKAMQMTEQLGNSNGMMNGGGASNPFSGSALGWLMGKLSGNQNSVNPLNTINGSGNSGSSTNALLINPVNDPQSSNIPTQQFTADGSGMGSSPSSSPLVPGTQGPGAGYAGQMTKSLYQSPYDKNLVADTTNPGRTISIPTDATTTAGQQALLAEKRVEPQLNRLADEWAPFMDLKGQGKVLGARIGNYLQSSFSPQTMGTLKQFGIEPNTDLPSAYAKAQSTTKFIPESLVKSFGLRPTVHAMSMLQEAIEPLLGESRDGYKNRIMQTLQELRTEQNQPTEQVLTGGFSSPPSGSLVSNTTANIKKQGQDFQNVPIKMQDPKTGKVYSVPQGKAQRFVENGFKRVV